MFMREGIYGLPVVAHRLIRISDTIITYQQILKSVYYNPGTYPEIFKKYRYIHESISRYPGNLAE
jgi:hypothetical protein